MIATPTPQMGQNLETDEELTAVRKLHQAAAAAGIQVIRKAVANVYASLKSHPFLILAGEKQTGKIEMVKCLGHILTETPTEQCQLFVGHARWAAQSQDVSRFVEMQARFNRSRLLTLMEEATRPENAKRLFIACLIRISAAELDAYFTIPGFQFWPDQALIEGAQAAVPIPYPPNFRLIGTMDTARFDWWEPDLLARTTVVDWRGQKKEGATGDGWQAAILCHHPSFLQTRIHSEQTAYTRLKRALGGRRQALLPLLQVRDLICQHNIPQPHKVTGWVIRYIANSWTEAGVGLFDTDPQNNLHQALDLALVQYVLPWIIATQPESTPLLNRLVEMFNGQFDLASTFVDAFKGGRRRVAISPTTYGPPGAFT